MECGYSLNLYPAYFLNGRKMEHPEDESRSGGEHLGKQDDEVRLAYFTLIRIIVI